MRTVSLLVMRLMSPLVPLRCTLTSRDYLEVVNYYVVGCKLYTLADREAVVYSKL